MNMSINSHFHLYLSALDDRMANISVHKTKKIVVSFTASEDTVTIADKCYFLVLSSEK